MSALTGSKISNIQDENKPQNPARDMVNGGFCGNLRHSAPASGFVAVVNGQARKPLLAISPNINATVKLTCNFTVAKS